MKGKKREKTVNKNLKGYSTLSILEREVYSRSKDYKPQFTNRSIMEIAIYHPTVHEKMSLWQKIQMKFLKTKSL